MEPRFNDARTIIRMMLGLALRSREGSESAEHAVKHATEGVAWAAQQESPTAVVAALDVLLQRPMAHPMAWEHLHRHLRIVYDYFSSPILEPTTSEAASETDSVTDRSPARDPEGSEEAEAIAHTDSEPSDSPTTPRKRNRGDGGK